MSKLMNLTGNIVDIFDLQKEDISAEVIILGACRINRFLGQTKYAYPVAAHLIGGYRYLEYIKASKTLCKNRSKPDNDARVRPDAKTEFNRTVKRCSTGH